MAATWLSRMLDLASPLDGMRSPFGARRGFSPLSLFSIGAQGFWYDPSDFSTMFQDNAGATPVTATGQSVGLIRDKSGKGNHASQSNASFKPVLNQDASGFYYLAFDGTDDFLLTSSIDFRSTGDITAWLGVRKLSDAATGMAIELSAAASAGTFSFRVPQGAAATFSFASSGTSTGTATSPASYAAPYTAVLTGIGNIANDRSILRLNGSQVAQDIVSDQGSVAYGNYPLYIGRRGGSSLALNARIYSLIGLGAAATALQLSTTETWVNARTGAY